MTNEAVSHSPRVDQLSVGAKTRHRRTASQTSGLASIGRRSTVQADGAENNSLFFLIQSITVIGVRPVTRWKPSATNAASPRRHAR